MSKVTAIAKSEFLDRLEQGDTVQAIADGMGIKRQSLYRHRLADETFRKAWSEAASIGSKIRLSMVAAASRIASARFANQLAVYLGPMDAARDRQA